MKIVAAVQPSFLPYLGFFELIKKSDQFLFYDHVQYDKNGWRNRNRFIVNNRIKWLTMPIKHGRIEKKLFEVELFKPDYYQRKILTTIKQNYSNHNNFDEFYKILQRIFTEKWIFLNDLNITLIVEICKYLKISIQYARTSDEENNPDKNLNLIQLCKKYGCNKYISGPKAKNYLNEKLFVDNGIVVKWHEFKHPTYDQKSSKKDSFISHLSVIDYIFNLKK